MVLQALEGLSDRDAANALRTNIAWKVAAGLALDDEGINYSVLTYWRSRLRASDRPERIFDAVRAVISETGVLTGKRRRALDSTLLDDAVATQDTVTQLVAAIRRVRRVVPGVAGVELTAHDYDTHMHKSRSEYRDGYKAHIAIEPETGLVTAAALTPANAGDGPAGVALLAGEAPGLQILADSAYGSGEVRAALRDARHAQAIKAIPLRRAVPDGFDRDDFVIDHDARTARCPAGHTVPIATRGGATFGARCQGCALRDRCTTSKRGRVLKIHNHDIELVEARRAWRDGTFADDYRQWRPMVERSISWLVARGHRRVRYRGIERNQHGLTLRVAAINLRRLVNLGLTRGTTGWALNQYGPGN